MPNQKQTHAKAVPWSGTTETYWNQKTHLFPREKQEEKKNQKNNQQSLTTTKNQEKNLGKQIKQSKPKANNGAFPLRVRRAFCFRPRSWAPPFLRS